VFEMAGAAAVFGDDVAVSTELGFDSFRRSNAALLQWEFARNNELNF